MASVLTQLTRGNLSLAFRSPEANLDTEAWTKMIGDRPVCTRFDTLPEAKPRWSALLTSTIFQLAVTVLLVAFPTLFPDKLVSKHSYEATSIISAQTEVVLPSTQPPVRAKVIPPPVAEPLQPQRVAKLIAPRPEIAVKPAPPPVKVDDVLILNEASPVQTLEPTRSGPVRPREPVKTGALETDSAAPATTNKPVAEVKTGGFGDPGLPADGNPKRANIARSGSFDLPPSRGYGNGTGGATGVRGTVAGAGFDDLGTSGGDGTRATIKVGGFEAAVAGFNASSPKQGEVPAALRPVAILETPKPVYSDEARKLGIEGEVLLDVIFRASGTVEVVRITSGLGHGLDEAAVRAAKQIRFKPAFENGKPMDFPAIIHIEFQLAF